MHAQRTCALTVCHVGNGHSLRHVMHDKLSKNIEFPGRRPPTWPTYRVQSISRLCDTALSRRQLDVQTRLACYSLTNCCHALRVHCFVVVVVVVVCMWLVITHTFRTQHVLFPPCCLSRHVSRLRWCETLTVLRLSSSFLHPFSSSPSSPSFCRCRRQSHQRPQRQPHQHPRRQQRQLPQLRLPPNHLPSRPRLPTAAQPVPLRPTM
jgi:hypothetical protein